MKPTVIERKIIWSQVMTKHLPSVQGMLLTDEGEMPFNAKDLVISRRAPYRLRYLLALCFIHFIQRRRFFFGNPERITNQVASYQNEIRFYRIDQRAEFGEPV